MGIVFTVATFLTLSASYSGIAKDLIFYGSIVTTIAAIIVPILSIKRFKFDSYKIKVLSLSIGVIGMIALCILESFNVEGITALRELSSKGLLWGLNTALLLFNLTYMEIENSDLKNKEEIKNLKEQEEKFILERELRIEELKKHQKTIIDLKNAKEELKRVKEDQQREK